MNHNDSLKKTCSLSILVTEKGFLENAYNLNRGLGRSLRLVGKIDESDQRTAFHQKSTAINFRLSSNDSWLEEMQVLTNEPEAIGAVSVAEFLAPLRYELDGETHENEPIQLRIELSPEAFEAICFHVTHLNENIISIKLELSGSALPSTDTNFVFLSDLDISKNKTYAVTSIAMSDTIFGND